MTGEGNRECSKEAAVEGEDESLENVNKMINKRHHKSKCLQKRGIISLLNVIKVSGHLRAK